MPTVYIPVTITVRRGELDLFDVDCKAHVEHDVPEGQDAPDWDVVSFHFAGPGELPKQRLSVPIHRHEPLFAVLYENLPHDYIDRRLSEMLDDE